MTVNDNRSLKMLIMILIFHKKDFRNKNYETLSQIKKGQICYWLPFSQITFGTPHISTIHLFGKILYKRKLHLYEPFQANVEYFIIVMKKEDNCAQLKHIFTCHEQS